MRPFPVIHMEPSKPAVTACPGMGATCISVSLWTHILHKYLFIELVFYLIVWWAEGTCSRHLEGIVGFSGMFAPGCPQLKLCVNIF